MIVAGEHGKQQPSPTRRLLRDSTGKYGLQEEARRADGIVLVLLPNEVSQVEGGEGS